MNLVIRTFQQHQQYHHHTRCLLSSTIEWGKCKVQRFWPYSVRSHDTFDPHHRRFTLTFSSCTHHSFPRSIDSNPTIYQKDRYVRDSTMMKRSFSFTLSPSQHQFRRTYTNSSSSSFPAIEGGADPVLDALALQQAVLNLAPSMAQGLVNNGYWTTPSAESDVNEILLPENMIQLLRKQAIELRRQGRYEQSWSERVAFDDKSGQYHKERFEKEGVFACEPDGQDYDIAPDLIVYMSVILQTLPNALNMALQDIATSQSSCNYEHPTPDLSSSSFNAKLAVTLPGGSTYPLHVDNPQGLVVHDTRKLTCILYLNPDYNAERGDGGELRLLVPQRDGVGNEELQEMQQHQQPTHHVDLPPDGGRMVLFWSDEIPHEVLPTAPNYIADENQDNDTDNDDDDHDGSSVTTNPLDRYALTLWIPTENISTIHNETSKFRSLRDVAFPPSLSSSSSQ